MSLKRRSFNTDSGTSRSFPVTTTGLSSATVTTSSPGRTGSATDRFALGGSLLEPVSLQPFALGTGSATDQWLRTRSRRPLAATDRFALDLRAPRRAALHHAHDQRGRGRSRAGGAGARRVVVNQFILVRRLFAATQFIG